MAESDRIRHYIANPADKKTQESLRRQGKKSASRGRPKERTRFAGATFAIELRDYKVLPSGQTQLTLLVPFENKAEVFKLTDTPGMLLEASVSAVEGIPK